VMEDYQKKNLLLVVYKMIIYEDYLHHQLHELTFISI
jgi:hypothetical protein